MWNKLNSGWEPVLWQKRSLLYLKPLLLKAWCASHLYWHHLWHSMSTPIWNLHVSKIPNNSICLITTAKTRDQQLTHSPSPSPLFNVEDQPRASHKTGKHSSQWANGTKCLLLEQDRNILDLSFFVIVVFNRTVYTNVMKKAATENKYGCGLCSNKTMQKTCMLLDCLSSIRPLKRLKTTDINYFICSFLLDFLGCKP